MTKFAKWPPEDIKPVIVTSEKVKNGDERLNIDYVITIGGDGTILTLLRNLQEYEKTRILPPIITFSQVKINFSSNILGLFELPW